MKGLLRPVSIGLASLALFSACPTTMQNQGIHDYVNRGLEIPTNQVSLYLGTREINDFSALDVDPERANLPGIGNYLPDFPTDPNPATKNLDVSDNLFIGIEYSEIIRDTIGWELGLFYSQEEDVTRQTVYTDLDTDGISGINPVTREVQTSIQMIELSLGGRYTYTRWLYLQPYAGAGLDLIVATLPKPSSDFNPAGLELDVTEWKTQTKLLYGGYGHVGVNFRVGSLLLGIDGRALIWADERINYLQAAVTIGYAF